MQFEIWADLGGPDQVPDGVGGKGDYQRLPNVTKDYRFRFALVVSNVRKCPCLKKFGMETFEGEGSLSDLFAGSYRMLSNSVYEMCGC